MNDYVWYCSYGSNMLYERFRLYIEGGTADFVDRIYKGCADKTLPSKSEGFNIPYEMYFAKRAAHWENLGVAFLKHKRNEHANTLGRIYKIRQDQFIEIFQQENGKEPNSELLKIDFELLEKTSTQSIGDSEEYRWYGKLLWLGSKEGFPVLSFTAKWKDGEIKSNKPGEKYLKTLIMGLNEFKKPSEIDIYKYFALMSGINHYYNKKELLSIIGEQKNDG